MVHKEGLKTELCQLYSQNKKKKKRHKNPKKQFHSLSYGICKHMGQVHHEICGPRYEMRVQSTCTKISRWQTFSIEGSSKYGTLGNLASHTSTELTALFT